VAHLWELGGGTWLSKLADLIITADALRSVDEASVGFLASDCFIIIGRLIKLMLRYFTYFGYD